MQLSDFKKGDTVKYTGRHHTHEIAGARAKVVRPVKSRQVVTIDWLDPMPGTLSLGYFDALPKNLTHIDEGAPE